jgi:hypothetical protein
MPSPAPPVERTPPVPDVLSSRNGLAVLDLLEHARSCLADAATAPTAGERYAAAHLAALRTAAAVIAARAAPRTGRGPRNAWVLLARVAPELAEWAAFFAAGAPKRAAAEAGLPHAVTAREADDLLRDVDRFLGRVCELLGLPHQESLIEVVTVLRAG